MQLTHIFKRTNLIIAIILDKTTFSFCTGLCKSLSKHGRSINCGPMTRYYTQQMQVFKRFLQKRCSEK